LHGGLPTDRFIAEWWIDSDRVHSVLSGQTAPHDPQVSISYPADIAQIRSQDSARARRIQQANAERFLSAFADGLAVTGFRRDEGEGTYLLEKWQ
jgi:predicted GNAT superfamily acetyltransferase